MLENSTSVGTDDSDDDENYGNDDDSDDVNDNDDVNDDDDDDINDDDDSTKSSVMCGWQQPISDNHQKQHIFFCCEGVVFSIYYIYSFSPVVYHQNEIVLWL